MKDLYYCESGDHYYIVYDDDFNAIYEYERDYESEYESGDCILFVEKDCPNHTKGENES